MKRNGKSPKQPTKRSAKRSSARRVASASRQKPSARRQVAHPPSAGAGAGADAPSALGFLPFGATSGLPSVPTGAVGSPFVDIPATLLDQMTKGAGAGEVVGFAEADEYASSQTKAVYWDPFALVQQMGFKERPSMVTYATLSAMVWRVAIVQAVMQTRISQVSAFATPQPHKFDVGFRVKMRDATARPSAADRKFIADMTRRLMACGVPDGGTRDSFEMFLRKIVRDSLTFDAACWEIVPDSMGRPAAWYAVDASTIRLADTARLSPNDDPDAIRTVQIYDNVIINEFTGRELAYMVRNPRTDIMAAGYGTPELEMVVSTVTALLWAWAYNQNFFCVAPGTMVTTRAGREPIEALAGSSFEVWNGREYHAARAFATGERSLVRTKLWNGLEIETSPEHRFLVLRDASMVPLWLPQSELRPNDTVLVDVSREGPDDLDEAALFVGRTYATDRVTGRTFTPTSAMVRDVRFWEWLGFMLGDGYWPAPDDRPAVLQTFPHYAKDAALFGYFLETATRHGVHAELAVINKTVERADGQLGYPAIHVCQRAFLEWLRDIGFSTSTDGKRIPAGLYKQPAWVREALLRGLFSADGHARTHVTGYRTPTVYAEDERFRQDILRCLFSVGVAAQNVGQGWTRSGEICVQDVPAFVERVGFLQAYKRRGIRRSPKSATRWDKLRPSYSQQLAHALMAHRGVCERLSPRDATYLRKAAAGLFVMSRPRAIALCAKLGCEPKVAMSYHHAPVDVVELPRQAHRVMMYDVEVFDEEHIFLANGVAVHNSQGSVAKGILNLKGTIPEKHLRAFRRQWYQMVSGIENAWRTPITNVEDAQWLNMHTSNRDMEYSSWMDFLIKVVCLAPGTRVAMADGTTCPIEQVRVGDEVLTHNGRARRVTAVMRKPSQEPLVHVARPYGPKIRATGEHPFRVVRSWRGTGDVRKFGDVTWRPASELDYKVSRAEQDFLVIPKADTPARPWALEIGPGTRAASAKEIPERLEVDTDLARFLGLYVAEGTASSNGSCKLTFHIDEVEFAEFAQRIVRERFGIEATIRVEAESSSRVVWFTSRRLSDFLRATFGTECAIMRMPHGLVNADLDIVRAFVVGAFEGDGHVGASGDVVITTASRAYADQLRYMCWRLGTLTGLQASTSTRNGTVCTCYSVRLLHPDLAREAHGPKGDKVRAVALDGSTHAYAFGPGWGVKMRGISSGEPSEDGFVYNLAVEEDESYLLEGGVAVHNCSVFLMDPVEINFKYGSTGQRSMFEGAQRAKAQESRERGLKPLLRALGREIDRTIIWPHSDDFSIEFVGLESQTPKEIADLMTQRVRTTYTINELRIEDDREPIENGDIILDPTWLAYQAQVRAEKLEEEQRKREEAEAVASSQNIGVDDLESMLAQLEGRPAGSKTSPVAPESAPEKPEKPQKPGENNVTKSVEIDVVLEET